MRAYWLIAAAAIALVLYSRRAELTGAGGTVTLSPFGEVTIADLLAPQPAPYAVDPYTGAPVEFSLGIPAGRAGAPGVYAE